MDNELEKSYGEMLDSVENINDKFEDSFSESEKININELDDDDVEIIVPNSDNPLDFEMPIEDSYSNETKNVSDKKPDIEQESNNDSFKEEINNYFNADDDAINKEINSEEIKPIPNNKLLDLIDKTSSSEEFFKELERHDH